MSVIWPVFGCGRGRDQTADTEFGNDVVEGVESGICAFGTRFSTRGETRILDAAGAESPSRRVPLSYLGTALREGDRVSLKVAASAGIIYKNLICGIPIRHSRPRHAAAI